MPIQNELLPINLNKDSCNNPIPLMPTHTSVTTATVNITNTTPVAIDSETNTLDINTRLENCLLRLSTANDTCTLATGMFNLCGIHHFNIVPGSYSYYSICTTTGGNPGGTVVIQKK